MPSPADRPPSSLSSPSSGRRIISRLTSPFASKSRSVVDYYIQLDDQHKQYSAGEDVSGCVRIRVAKPIRVTHIVVCLHGYVQVFKHPGSQGESNRANTGYLGTGSGKKSGEYFGNGFASLFEDEVVLCGDGRLAEGSYQFNFELEFPDRDLPSSVDFERGTISYMVTAVMTRPNTMTPTMTCETKIFFVERIDISPLYPPKPRTITLEPISKRARVKHQARKLVDPSERRTRKPGSTPGSQQQRDLGTLSASKLQQQMQADGDLPLSPAPSEISFDSATSINERTSQPDSASLSPGGSNAKPNQSKSSLGGRAITATVESLTGGCLRGDSIPIKINIKHTKHVKSLYGVILTLYRHARVDMHPAIPLGPTEKGSDTKYEDYYPKSVTGLGGLSLSGAGSSHTFRKDLSQTMHPLIIDPIKLVAEINAKVRVPEDLFPTISTVPGGMISFKYFVEVLVDIQGKLAGQDRNLGNFNAAPSEAFEGERAAFTPSLSTILDTSQIRRDKSVIASVFEVVIGTRDSERRKGKRKLDAVAQPEVSHTQAGQPTVQLERTPGAQYESLEPQESDWRHLTRPATAALAHAHADAPVYYDAGQENMPYDLPPPDVPIPQMPDEAQLSEKERMRLAETRLLPSQPPGYDGQAGAGAGEASAPYLPEETGCAAESLTGPSAPVYSAMPGLPALPSGEAMVSEHPAPASLAREYAPWATGPSQPGIALPSDDKHELQRQRLQFEASAPPMDDDDVEASVAAPNHEPSAPAFDDVHSPNSPMHDSHAGAAGSPGLPRYER